MQKIASLAALALILTACGGSDLDKVMGRSVEGTPTTEPRKVHCDLIFPGGTNVNQ